MLHNCVFDIGNIQFFPVKTFLYIEKSFHRKKLNIADIEDTIMQHNMANPLSLTTKSKTDTLEKSIKQEKERSNTLA